MIMNIACQESYSLLDLLKVLNVILGTTIEPEFGPSRKGEVKHSLADISLARNRIKYDPTIKWKEGLVKTVEWYKRNS
jgi:nucleoside-diphosphate-sugar epimerase